MAMESVFQHINNGPAQDFCPAPRMSAEQVMKTELTKMILPHKTSELDTICDNLKRFLVSVPSGRYLIEFDVEPGTDGRPAKYPKQYVFNFLDDIFCLLECNKTYYFWWVAQYTNLADNVETVKTMHKRHAKEQA